MESTAPRSESQPQEVIQFPDTTQFPYKERSIIWRVTDPVIMVSTWLRRSEMLQEVRNRLAIGTWWGPLNLEPISGSHRCMKSSPSIHPGHCNCPSKVFMFWIYSFHSIRTRTWGVSSFIFTCSRESAQVTMFVNISSLASEPSH